MKVGLFVPCFLDQVHPEVAVATLRVLERVGFEVVFPEGPGAPVCCGQPLWNLGHAEEAGRSARAFATAYAGVDAVVCPSGSCTAMLRVHAPSGLDDGGRAVCARTFELCEFLHAHGAAATLGATFARRVSIHRGCHHLRELRAGPASERAVAESETPDVVRAVLETVAGIELVEPAQRDACCGFGGTFCVSEEAVSARMGEDRLDDHLSAGAEVVASADMSCLMHLDGLRRRRGDRLRFVHVAQILAGEAGA